MNFGRVSLGIWLRGQNEAYNKGKIYSKVVYIYMCKSHGKLAVE